MPATTESTYDQLMRQTLRIIVRCEAEKMRLRAQQVALALEELVAGMLSPEAAAELEELQEAIENQIRAVQGVEDAAKALRAGLRRDHGEIRWARAGSPGGGAEKRHYAETGAPAQ